MGKWGKALKQSPYTMPMTRKCGKVGNRELVAQRRYQVCCLRPAALTGTGKRIAGSSDTLIANETKAGRGETEKCHMPIGPPKGSSPAYSGPF